MLAAVLRFSTIGRRASGSTRATPRCSCTSRRAGCSGCSRTNESTPPLYYCVAWVWARIFGYGEAGLRSLSAVAGVAAVPVGVPGRAQARFRPAGTVAAALAACNPILIWYSQEARAYELLVLLGTRRVLAFAYARERPTPSAGRLGARLGAGAGHPLLRRAHRRARGGVAARRPPATPGRLGGRGRSRGLRRWPVPLALSQNATGRASWIAGDPAGRRLGAVFPQLLIGTGTRLHRARDRLALVLAALASRCSSSARIRASAAAAAGRRHGRGRR